MTKLGASILSLIVLAIIGFATMLSFGPAKPPRALPSKEAPPPPVLQPASTALAIPVAGVTADALVDTWGDTRGEGTRHHNAIDIMAPANTPVLAAASGTVEKLFNSKAGG